MELEGLIVIGIYIVSILFSMTFHEAMHAFTSHWLGDDTAYRLGRLTLNPLKHIDPFTTIIMPILLVLAGLPPFGAAKPVPFNPYRVKYGEFGAALVGLAGPLTNLFLAVFAGLWARFIFGLEGVISDIFVLFMFVNLAFFTFNMIPWPPLDGSRLLFAIAPEPVQNVMRQIEGYGIMGIAIFIFVFYQFFAPIVVAIVEALSRLIIGQSLGF